MVLTLAHHAGERALYSRCKPIVLAPSLRPCSPLAKQHPLSCLDVGAPLLRTRARTLRCRSSTEQQADAQKAEAGSSETKIKQTLADLDALLGIEEEKKEEKQQERPQEPVQITITPEVLQTLAAAEAARKAANSAAGGADATETGLNDQMVTTTSHPVNRQQPTHTFDITQSKIVEQAKRIAADPNSENSAGEQALRKEFDTLLTMLKPADAIDKDDLKIIKEQVFKKLNFWVTDTIPSAEPDGGVLIRGNLRGDMTELFDSVTSAMEAQFGDKYTVLMVEDTEAAMLEEDDTTARPAFQLVPTALAQPRPTAGWQVVVALVLLGFTLVSSLQVGLVANIAKLPKETLEWLARPENVNSDVLPPGLETWDPTTYIATALPISLGVFGVALMRELGTRLAAGVKGVKLGPAFFIPNGQIGSFGSSSPLKGFLRNRTDLFDLAFAGAAMGGGTALALFVAGLVATQSGEVPKELLVPIPSALFQGSLLLGFVTKAGLGEQALRSATVYVHPYLIAGWCGLVGTALNCLPVGSIDGGRMMQAAFGRGSLSFSGFFTYVGLGLGFLGSSLSLPYGIYVLICQRNAERYIQDNLSPISDQRRIAAAVLVLTAILVLLPMAPEIADTAGIGPQSWSL